MKNMLNVFLLPQVRRAFCLIVFLKINVKYLVYWTLIYVLINQLQNITTQSYVFQEL